MTPARRLLSAGYNNNLVGKIFLLIFGIAIDGAAIVRRTRRDPTFHPTVAHPSPVSKKGREKKKKISSPPPGNIKQPLGSFPPSSPGIHGAPVHFHARPLHFLTSSRLTTSSLKRGQDSLKRPDPPSDHTEEANENWNPFSPPPPLLLYLLNLLPLSSRCSIRARLKEGSCNEEGGVAHPVNTQGFRPRGKPFRVDGYTL